MDRRTTHPDAVALAAATWLACGCVLLGLTPLPAHDAYWGWAPGFWLLVAPVLVLGARRLCPLPVCRASSGRNGQGRIARDRHATGAAYAPGRGHGTPRRRQGRRARQAG